MGVGAGLRKDEGMKEKERERERERDRQTDREREKEKERDSLETRRKGRRGRER